MNRNFGLDIIRSTAIIMVLLSHSKLFFLSYVQDKANFISLGVFGFYGVELFFVLSGFLIGQILLRDVINIPSAYSIISFYIRRWFRTLPAYYLVLIVFVIASNVFKPLPAMNFHPSYFLFMQNFSTRALDFFGVSWSLAIEEWFYFLTPLLFTVFLPKKHDKIQVARLLISSIIILNLIRMVFIYYVNPTWNGIRQFVPLRFDSLLLGILLAHLKQISPHYYKKLNNLHVLGLVFFCLTGLAIFFISQLLSGTIDHSFFARTILFTLISFFMTLCIPFFEQSNFVNKSIKNITIIRCAFTSISLYSYTIYLIHLDVFIYFSKLSTSIISSIIFLLISLIVTFFISVFIYKYYEKPIMDLRDKFKLCYFKQEQEKI